MRMIAATTRLIQRHEPLEKLRSLVLMGGSVRPTPFHLGVGRSVLDLPVDDGRTVLSTWHDEATRVARVLAREQLPVRLIIDRFGREPAVPAPVANVGFSVERDPGEYRGTAGVLRDLATEYADDDYLLVATAGQLLLEPLSQLLHEMAAVIADVCLVTHQGGTPGGLLLIRCGSLREVAATGFVDLKEQALPQIAKRHRVAVLNRPEPASLPLRTGADYTLALSRFHDRFRCGGHPHRPFTEDWETKFSTVEGGAQVHGSARVHDSVVLRGARVEREAVLVRSVVCPGATVSRGSMIVDQLVRPGPGRSIFRGRK